MEIYNLNFKVKIAGVNIINNMLDNIDRQYIINSENKSTNQKNILTKRLEL